MARGGRDGAAMAEVARKGVATAAPVAASRYRTTGNSRAATAVVSLLFKQPWGSGGTAALLVVLEEVASVIEVDPSSQWGELVAA